MISILWEINVYSLKINGHWINLAYNNTKGTIMLDIWKLFSENNLSLSFPNLHTEIQLYLTIPIAYR